MEHKDKYNKPWAVWAFEKCRECQHPRFMHIADIPTHDNFNTAIVSNCNDVSKGMGFCPCEEFMPTDNLDYIEFLAKRKGIIPED